MMKTIEPLYVFERRSRDEREAGYLLAGTLVIDWPDSKEEEKFITNIQQHLVDKARSGEMCEDAFIIGWIDNKSPQNRIDTDNDEVLAKWAKDRLKIRVIVPKVA
jgi:hypothetical protein